MVLEVMMLGALRALVGVMAPDSSAYSGLENQIRVTVPRIEEAEVVIDGLLDEPVWEGAATLTGFSQYAPADGRAGGEPDRGPGLVLADRHLFRRPR